MTLSRMPSRPTDLRVEHQFDSLRLTAVAEPGRQAVYSMLLGQHYGAFPADRLRPMLRWLRTLVGDTAKVRKLDGIFVRVEEAHAEAQAILAAPAPLHTIRVGDKRIHFVTDARAVKRFVRLNLIGEWPYEAGVMRYLMARLHADELFVDVGAHAGFFSLIACSLGAIAYAIEPQRDLIRVIERNAAINGADRLHALALAVSDHEGLTGMLRLGGSPGMQMHGERIDDLQPTPQNRHVDWIPTVRLDSLFDADIVRPRIVKIDVEGLELRALAGAAALIARRETAFVVELHPQLVAGFGGDLQSLAEHFDGPDWRVVDVSADPPVPIALADGIARATGEDLDGRVTLAFEPASWDGPFRR